MATCRNCRYYEILSITACSLGKCKQQPTLVRECAAQACISSIWTTSGMPPSVQYPPQICGQCAHWDLIPPGSTLELCTYRDPERFVITGSRFVCGDFDIISITEEEAEQLWQEYLAAQVAQLKRKAEKKARKRKKKKRHWGIYHETYGWLDTGSGADFVTSRKRTARREAAKWLVHFHWRIKRYDPNAGVKEKDDGSV